MPSGCSSLLHVGKAWVVASLGQRPTEKFVHVEAHAACMLADPRFRGKCRLVLFTVALVLALGAQIGAPKPGTAAAGIPPSQRLYVPTRRMPTLRRATDANLADADLTDFVTSEDVSAAAKRLSVELRETATGPFYQMELYSGDQQVGKTSGWAQPWGVMHLETIEVRRFTGYWTAKPAGQSGSTAPEEPVDERKRYADIAKVARWFGLLLAVSIACWNRERSPIYCKEAHLLAIKDEEKQHRRLVRYYKSLGFKTLREPDELTFQDQLVWGGDGTLMDVQGDEFLNRWSPLIRELATA